MSFNKVILMGNLTRDPEYRVTSGGNNLCTFGIAMNDRVQNKATGTWEDKPVFVDVDAWGNQAENISKFFSKGRQILIEGRLRLDEWENQQGERRTKLKVVLDRFSFVNDGQSRQVGGGAPAQAAPVAQVAPQTDADPQPQERDSPEPASKDGDDGDDVPF
jgi:single-strand DNA-binding protein